MPSSDRHKERTLPGIKMPERPFFRGWDITGIDENISNPVLLAANKLGYIPFAHPRWRHS